MMVVFKTVLVDYDANEKLKKKTIKPYIGAIMYCDIPIKPDLWWNKTDCIPPEIAHTAYNLNVVPRKKLP